MSGALLDAEMVSKHFGGFVALDAVNLEVGEGERLGLIGPNGSGKTTLINCISGALTCDAGRVVFDGHDVTRMPAHRRARLGIARSFQIPKPFRSMTLLDNLRVSLEYAARSRVERRRIADEAMSILSDIGLGARAGERADNLTQVDMRKLELARALAGKPRLLISDEAMAGLSSAEVDEVLEILMTLNRDGVAVIMIEHIMHAVMRFSERIVVLDAGRRIAEGAPEAVARDPEVERAYLGE